MAKRSLFLIALLVAAACAPVGRSLNTAGETIHRETVKFDHALIRNLGGVPAAAPPVMQVEQAFCYKTLAQPQCYPYPIPGWEERLIGKQVPPPPPVVVVQETVAQSPMYEIEPMAAQVEGPVAVYMNDIDEARAMPLAEVPAEPTPADRQPRPLMPHFSE